MLNTQGVHVKGFVNSREITRFVEMQSSNDPAVSPTPTQKPNLLSRYVTTDTKATTMDCGTTVMRVM
jgi:hypothetical protein